MHFYRLTIALFGLVVPVLIVVAVVGLGFFAKSRMASSFESKETSYKEYELSKLAGSEMEKKISRQRPHLERWDHLLQQETASTVTNHLREIIEKLPSKEIQQTAFDPSGSGGFGAVSAQKSSQVRIALRGTYRTVQRAFLELETRMPHLQLQELRIDPNSTQSTLLNFQVSYTAWEN